MRRHSAVFLVLLTAGCASARPEVESVPQSTPSGVTTIPASRSGQSSFVFQPDTSTHSYTATLTTVLELAGAGGSTNDSIVLTANYTFSALPRSPAARIRGTVNGVTVRTGSRIGTATDSLAFPFSFAGSVAGSLPQLDSVAGNLVTPPLTCASPELATLAPLYQILTVLPETVPTAGEWADSSTVPMCNGRIPVELTVIRTFRFLGESRHGAQRVLLIERSARTRSAGNGSEGQHHIAVGSQGSGTDTLRVNAQTGMLVASSGQHISRVTVTSSGRIQEFRQHIRQQTEEILRRK